MKTILSSRRDHYLAKFSIFLITVALVAGMVGCGPTGYELTISSTEGGEVTTPGEETFTYEKGEVVNLVAEPDEGYRFISWTGDVKTIDDVNAEETTIIMNGDYFTISIKAEFDPGLEIEDWNDLRDISENLYGHHILTTDLDSTMAGYDKWVDPDSTDGYGWEPIETFKGTFDGQEYEIRDLFIDRPDKTGVGLFGYVGVEGKIMDLGVVNASVTGEGGVGVLVGMNRGTVTSSYSTGNVEGNDKIGGLVGFNILDGKVSKSHSTGTVNGSGEYVGGLVGKNAATVLESYSSCNVTGSNMYVGGLVGSNQGTVESSNSTGNVTGLTDSLQVGGLVGHNEGTVENSYSSGNVTGSNMYVGGLVGWNGDTVSDSHSSGNVIGSGEHVRYVGGLVGWNQGTVEGTVEEKSYSTGNVKGNEKVGGLVGFNNDGGTVSKSHSTGSVTGEEGHDIGGLVGWNEGTVEDSYSSSAVSGLWHVGGLVGENLDTVECSNSTGNVTGLTGSLQVGGLVGWNQGTKATVSDSYFKGNVAGDTYVGGLVGQNDGTVKRSYSTGSVKGPTRDGGWVGGLVGYNFWGSTVSDSYSTCSVSGYMYVGGLVGFNEQSDVIMCYSTGEVTGGRDVGGLVGENSNGDVLNSFWDTQTSKQPTLSDGGTGKTHKDMKKFKTYTEIEPEVLDEKWDIFPVDPGETETAYFWNIVDGNTYPYLTFRECQSV